MPWSADWRLDRAEKLGLTFEQYTAYADLEHAYHRDTCLCEWDGGYGDDGSQHRRIVPNPHCNMHRAEDGEERLEAKRRTWQWSITSKFDHCIHIAHVQERGLLVPRTFVYFIEFGARMVAPEQLEAQNKALSGLALLARLCQGGDL